MKVISLSYITLLIYPILAVILLFGFKRAKKGEFNEEWNSFSETKAIQGLMALCIVCHHTAQQTCVNWLPSGNIVNGLNVFSDTGFLFVGVFFFWSGYGLFKSFKSKQKYLSRFVSKRVVPVLVPYVIVCFLFTLERIFVFKEKMPLWFKITNFTGITIGYYFGWYIQAIVVFYLVFYFAFKYSRYDFDAILYVFAGVLLWVVAGLIIDHNDYFMRGQWWYNSTMLFPFGVLFAKNESKIIEFLKKRFKILVPSSIILFFLSFFFSRFMEFIGGYYGEMMGFPFSKKILYRVLTLTPQLLAAVMFTLILLLICMKAKFHNKVLDFLGSHTLEIYLTHAFFLEFFAISYNYKRDSIFYARPWLLLLVTFILTIPAAVLLKKACNLICKKLVR